MYYMYNLRNQNTIRLTTVSIQNTVFSKCFIIYIYKMRFDVLYVLQRWPVLLVVKETDIDH